MGCDCGCHDTPGTLRCEVCADAHKPAVANVEVVKPITHLPQAPEKKQDEFGDIYVFSEARLAKLKSQANTEYATMCDIVKKAESALSGFAEWARNAEANEKRFVAASKAYVATLKAVQDEVFLPKF